MDETEFIWMDGKLVKWQDAKIHVLTHTLHYGMGVFEGIRFYNTKTGPAIFRLYDHTTRLFAGAIKCYMQVPYTEDDINKATIETVKANKINSGYIRPLFYYGYGKMGLDPHGAPVNVSIACWPWGKYLGEEAVRVKTSKYMRIHPETTHAEAKITGHYVNSIFAGCHAKELGYDEALLLDYKGNVAEGPGENLFIIKKGKIFTPKLGNILQGITRKSVIELSIDMGLDVTEADLSLKEVYSADEAFFTGTAAEVSPIKSIDDHQFGSHLLTEKIRARFMDIVTGKEEKYFRWLTFVK
jgi:branched-chain amino acid aminotransferase